MRVLKISVLSLLGAVFGEAAYNQTHGAVAMEIAECSQVGADMLSMGGNAADAMIAGSLCVGTVASYHWYFC
jgi:gamma-glutamyltranspeptidase/glutathione hydrolase